MINNVKKFISRFTDKPIYKGTGVTSSDTYTEIDEVTCYKLNGTDYIYEFQRVSVGKKTGVIYYILQRIDVKEEMVVSAMVFNQIFTRIAN